MKRSFFTETSLGIPFHALYTHFLELKKLQII